MKKVNLLSIIFLLSFSLFIMSCVDEYPNISSDSPKNNLNSELAYRNLLSAGFRPEDIVVKDDYFVVEGDIVITVDEIDDYVFDCGKQNKNNKITQAATDGVVSISKVDNIYVEIHNSLKGTSWESAIRSAMSNWNNISNCRINFIEYTDSPPPPPGGGDKPPIAISTQSLTTDILIISDESTETPACMANLYTNIYAAARFPSNGSPGPYVSINISHTNLTQNERIWIVVHELGHTLGLRHTNWFINENEDAQGLCEYVYGANTLAGTPTDDGSSIMNKGILGSWSSFSNYDMIASRALYPTSLDASVHSGRNWDYQIQDYVYTIDIGHYATGPWSDLEVYYDDSGTWILMPDYVWGGYRSHYESRDWYENSISLKIVLWNYAGDYTNTVYKTATF